LDIYALLDVRATALVDAIEGRVRDIAVNRDQSVTIDGGTEGGSGVSNFHGRKPFL